MIFLKILGKKNEKYKVGTGTIEGRFYIDIYIKDLKTNKTFNNKKRQYTYLLWKCWDKIIFNVILVVVWNR